MLSSQTIDTYEIKQPSRIMLVSGLVLLSIISFILFFGTWQTNLLGIDEDVFKHIPKYIGENKDFFKVQPHTPITNASYILLQKITNSPRFQYIFNWLLHTINTLFLFSLLARRSKDIISFILAILIACFFLIHPLNIYSNSFLINRGGLLASLTGLLFLTILTSLKENSSFYTFTTFLGIVLILISTFSHFIGIIFTIPFLNLLLSNNIKKSNSFYTRFGCVLLFLIVITFVLISLHQYNNQTNIYESFPQFKYFSIISGFFVVTIFPTTFFPLQYFEINSYLSIPITLVLFFLLGIIGIYSYKKSDSMSFFASLMLFAGILIYPLFQRLDKSMCNSSYILILSVLILCYYLTLSTYLKNIFIEKVFTLFIAVILILLSIFSIQLLNELRDPERLWLSCAGNYTSNTEAWKYLARTITRKAKQQTTPNNIYLEKAEQYWDNLLYLQPENTEALREKALLCLETGRYEEARKNIERAVSLNPFDNQNVQTQIQILEKCLEQEHTDTSTLKQLYNSYIHLFLIDKNVSIDGKEKFVKIAQKLCNHEKTGEILKEDFSFLSNENDSFQKEYDELLKTFYKIPAVLGSSGDTFNAPYQEIADYYQKKGIIPLSLAWLNYGLQKSPDIKDLLIKLGTLYGKTGKSKQFIEGWNNYFNSDNSLWERLAQECIKNNDFSSANQYIDQTSYTQGKKFLILSRMAIEKGDLEQAKLWLEKAKENELSPEEIEEVNQYINKIKQ